MLYLPHITIGIKGFFYIIISFLQQRKVSCVIIAEIKLKYLMKSEMLQHKNCSRLSEMSSNTCCLLITQSYIIKKMKMSLNVIGSVKNSLWMSLCVFRVQSKT